MPLPLGAAESHLKRLKAGGSVLLFRSSNLGDPISAEGRKRLGGGGNQPTPRLPRRLPSIQNLKRRHSLVRVFHRNLHHHHHDHTTATTTASSSTSTTLSLTPEKHAPLLLTNSDSPVCIVMSSRPPLTNGAPGAGLVLHVPK